MTGIIAWMVARGVPQRLVRPILLAGAIIGGAILLWVVIKAIVASHDNRVIERHEQGVALDTEQVMRKADNYAADMRRDDDRREIEQAHELKEVTTNEAMDAGARRRAYYDRVRAQQAASGR